MLLAAEAAPELLLERSGATIVLFERHDGKETYFGDEMPIRLAGPTVDFEGKLAGGKVSALMRVEPGAGDNFTVRSRLTASWPRANPLPSDALGSAFPETFLIFNVTAPRPS